MPTAQILPIDARVVALNATASYLIDAEDRSFIERIDEVFLYDRNERTCCCELTPSYYLIHLYTSVVFRRDKLPDERRQEEIEQQYAFLPTDNCYVHCHTIDAIAERAEPFRYHRHGEPGFETCRAEFDSDQAWHDAVMEALREHFCANHPI